MIKTLKKTIKLIPKNYRNTSSNLIFFLLIGSILEIFSIGMFIPILGELTTSDLIIIKKIKIFILNFLEVDNENQ